METMLQIGKYVPIVIGVVTTISYIILKIFRRRDYMLQMGIITAELSVISLLYTIALIGSMFLPIV